MKGILMKNTITHTIVTGFAVFALSPTTALADSTASAGASAGAGASATNNLNVDGAVGVGAVGGANGCAVGGGLGIPGVAGFTVTYSEESCVTNNEAEAIARFCGAGANTAPCRHLWMNNSKIEASLRAAGMIVNPPAQTRLVPNDSYGGNKVQTSTRTVSPQTAPQAPAASAFEPYTVLIGGGKQITISDAAIDAAFKNCETGLQVADEAGNIRILSAPSCS